MRHVLATITAFVVVVLAPVALNPISTSAQSNEPASIHQLFIPMIAGPTRTSSPADQVMADEVLSIVNAERAQANCGPLTINNQLTAAAQGHSEDMATQNYFSHTSLDGSSAADRVTRAGYDWSMVAENIAAGQTTAAQVMTSWMNSPGHRANILNCSYTEIGIGHVYESGDTFPGPYGYDHYWTQNFARSWD